MDRGWDVYFIPVWDSWPLIPAVADHLVAYAQLRRGDPSARREYRVVWGAGQFVTAGSAQDDDFSTDPPFRLRRNATTGRYERVA
jgi:hypothetical protein